MANEITAQRASEFGIEGQRDGESDGVFRSRVAGILRSQGHIIEAHEAYNNALYDDPTSPNGMLGILGAVAQDFHGIDYGATDGEQQVGHDLAAGIVADAPKEDDSFVKLWLFALLGGRR